MRLKIMCNHILKKDSERSQYYHKRCGRRIESETKELKKLAPLVGKAAGVMAAQNADGKLDAAVVAAQAAEFEERTAKSIADCKKRIADIKEEETGWWAKCIGTTPLPPAPSFVLCFVGCNRL